MKKKYFSLHFDRNLAFEERIIVKFEPKITKTTLRENENVTLPQHGLSYMAWNDLYGLINFIIFLFSNSRFPVK